MKIISSLPSCAHSTLQPLLPHAIGWTWHCTTQNLIPNAWFSLCLAAHHLSAQRTRALLFRAQVGCLTASILCCVNLPINSRPSAACPAVAAADQAMDPPTIRRHSTKGARGCFDPRPRRCQFGSAIFSAKGLSPPQFLARTARKGVVFGDLALASGDGPASSRANLAGLARITFYLLELVCQQYARHAYSTIVQLLWYSTLAIKQICGCTNCGQATISFK